MAAGAACKMRMWEPTDQICKTLERKLYDYRQFMATFKLFEIIYSGASAATKTEISAPNAVFNGTSASVPLGIVSSDAKDTAAGVGVRTVDVININDDGSYEITTLTMAGATTVTWNEFPQRLMHMYMKTVGSENDAAGNITLFRRAYDSMTDIAATSEAADSGLTASTQYYWKVNADGAGVVEYDITLGTDTSWTAVLALMNAEMAGVGIVASITDGYLRLTSDAGTSVATTAGATGTDLLVTAGGTTAVNSAKEVYLTIAAGYNESDGAAIFLPDDYGARVIDADLSQLTLANAGQSVLTVDYTYCDNNGADPDLDKITEVTGADTGTKHFDEKSLHISDTQGKVTFSENRITGQETLFTHIFVAVFGTSTTLRGYDVGAE